jgi:hypothetical protein
MADLKQILNDAVDTLNNKIKDLSTISVTTITGDVAGIFDTNNKIDLTNVVASLNTNATGKIELVAHTEVKFDNDAILFVKKSFSENDQKNFELHQAMVNSAIEARKSFIEFIGKVLLK